MIVSAEFKNYASILGILQDMWPAPKISHSHYLQYIPDSPAESAKWNPIQRILIFQTAKTPTPHNHPLPLLQPLLNYALGRNLNFVPDPAR